MNKGITSFLSNIIAEIRLAANNQEFDVRTILLPAENRHFKSSQSRLNGSYEGDESNEN